MIQIAICDDEPFMLDDLFDRLNKYAGQRGLAFHISRFCSGQSVLESNTVFDVLFLDIRMQPTDGMEVARRLRAANFTGLLIFTTVLKENVFDSFEVGAFDYLIKPLEDKRFEHTMDRVVSVLKKHDMSGAQNYLEKLDASVLGLSFPVCTGVPVLDILLGNKLKLAEDSGISVEVSLIDPIIEIDDLDSCIIFSNALDNAITACKEAGKDSYIHITGKQQGDFYMLNFENTCVPDVQKHMGIGLSNIKESVEKYGGALSIETEHSCFLLSILWQKNR